VSALFLILSYIVQNDRVTGLKSLIQGKTLYAVNDLQREGAIDCGEGLSFSGKEVLVSAGFMKDGLQCYLILAGCQNNSLVASDKLKQLKTETGFKNLI